jgi:CheY-like chemotaxis protein
MASRGGPPCARCPRRQRRTTSDVFMDTRFDNPAQILIIDDNHGSVQDLREALSECGEPYALTVLQDGDAALRFVADHRSGLCDSEPCVIVLDLNLPKHDALAVLAAIRAEPALAHIRVLVVSTLAVPATQALLRAMGGLYREKPRDLPGFLDLAAQVFVLCNKRRGSRAYANKELVPTQKNSLRSQG